MAGAVSLCARSGAIHSRHFLRTSVKGRAVNIPLIDSQITTETMSLEMFGGRLCPNSISIQGDQGAPVAFPDPANWIARCFKPEGASAPRLVSAPAPSPDR